MKSLDFLASGVNGASNGSVDIYVRGTSTRAQVFTDYDGAGAQTPVASLPLDANGGAVWYVNQPVLVIVRDVDGDPVRQFTVFDTATDVEVISQSFTGTNYTTGVSGTFQPTLLSKILDDWLTSAGAPDWNVIIGGQFGTIRTIQAAITAVSGIFFNVKDPAYGAAGDGVTDDRIAVQAAITAANAVGGIVWLPPTTTGYLIGSPGLTVNGAAGIWGANGTLITSTFAGGTTLTITTGSTNKFSIRNLRMTTTSTTNVLVTLQGTQDLVVDNCTFSSVGARQIDQTGTGDVGLTNSFFTATVTGTVGAIGNFLGPVVAINCEFSVSASTTTGAAMLQCNNGGIFLGTRHQLPGTIRYTEYIRFLTAAPQAIVLGCAFGNSPAASTTGIAQSSGGIAVFEYGNSFGTNVVPVTRAIAGGDTTIMQSRFGSLETNGFYATDDTAAVTLSGSYRMFRINRTTGGAQTINTPTPLTEGETMSILIINNSGGGGGVETLTTIKGCATVTPAVNERVLIVARSEIVAGVYNWIALTGATGVHYT